jgi:DNA-binding NarL/FixJ family response regulator
MGHTIRIIIADDQAQARHALKAVLANWPEIEVTAEAANGKEAVDLVERYKPDTVLMDVRMPVMDGLQATRWIKSHWPQVRVVVLTMYAAERIEAMAAGADAFLLKGDPIERLLNALSSSSNGHANGSIEPKGM